MTVYATVSGALALVLATPAPAQFAPQPVSESGARAAAAAKQQECRCWLGPKPTSGGSYTKHTKWKDFGIIAYYNYLDTGKKIKCAQACSKKCTDSGLLSNPQALCTAAGKEISAANASGAGCFSIVGDWESYSNTADYDGYVSSAFTGCKNCITCPSGWWDGNRKSCVVGAGCNPPGMPNGDKGGGYFVWDGKLFRDTPGAQASLIAGQTCPAVGSGTWTPWLDRDDPSGQGDYEILAAVAAQVPCQNPTQVECRRVSDGANWAATGQKYTCGPTVGGRCVNSQNGGACDDYEVRFYCPK